MLDNDESFRKFTGLLQSYLPLSGSGPLDPSANLMDLGLDSLNTVEILVRLEEAFDIRLPDEELIMETFETVGSLWSVLTGIANSPADESAGRR
jgi:acyl carrier protein